MISEESILHIREFLSKFFSGDPLELSPLSKRGSQRDFFRLKLKDGRTFIVIIYDPERVENTYYAGIARFLKSIGIPVPSIVYEAKEENILVVEDLGDLDLFSFKDLDWEMRKPLYEKTILSLSRLHRYPLENFPSTEVRIAEGFDALLYAWEREYFIENFVRGVTGIEIDPLFFVELKREFEKLTSDLMSLPSCLIHRDCQSKNVMVKEGSVYFIDFQGMRKGNPFYDLGSLVFDPYVSLLEKEREELIRFYCETSNWKNSLSEAKEAVYRASIQRIMQALGAFGFLWKKRGLKEYMEYVPQALKNLYYLLKNERMEKLKELVISCGSALGVEL